MRSGTRTVMSSTGTIVSGALATATSMRRGPDMVILRPLKRSVAGCNTGDLNKSVMARLNTALTGPSTSATKGRSVVTTGPSIVFIMCVPCTNSSPRAMGRDRLTIVGSSRTLRDLSTMGGNHICPVVLDRVCTDTAHARSNVRAFTGKLCPSIGLS